MTLLFLLLFAIIGSVAGVLGGMLGISGGLTTVPALFFMFTWMDFPPPLVMHLAIGTALSSMVLNAFSSARAHALKHQVIWALVRKVTPGLVIGAFLGAFVAHELAGTTLKYIFGIGIFCLGIYMLFWRPKETRSTPLFPRGPFVSLLAFFVAGVSSLLGIGGGSLIVPSLLAFRVNLRRAVGTSAAMGLIITAAGALSYLYLSSHIQTTPLSIGYIYLPAFIMLSVSTFIAAPYGAYLTKVLPSPLIRRIFAIVLIATGLSMMLK